MAESAILREDHTALEPLLTHANSILPGMDAIQRIEWASNNLPDNQILTSSFGIQSAVMLHLVNTVVPGIPVVLIDTGYLFDETYQFIDQLNDKLNLNLHIYSSCMSPAWQEARYGKLWEQGLEGLEKYNQINKVHPMSEALEDQDVGSWYAGLRRDQSTSRQDLPILKVQKDRVKIHPILDWSNRDVHMYLKKHDLPYHPLWEKGYVSVGDWHSSRPLSEGMLEEETRFFGLKRECGLHE